MTDKQKALGLIKQLGCSCKFTKGYSPETWGSSISIRIFPPEGYMFIDGLLSLLFHSWAEVIDELPLFEIIPILKLFQY